jgi:hypothetical protein
MDDRYVSSYGGYLFAFTETINELRLPDQMARQSFDKQINVPSWERPEQGILFVKTFVDTVFFFVTVIVLMNLLIAMMSITSTDVLMISELFWLPAECIVHFPWNLADLLSHDRSSR